MSLIVLYNDTLVADQRCVLLYPYAYGHSYNAKKIQVSKDKTFAFGSVGPTLTDKEKDILENIIAAAFKEAGGQKPYINIGHSDFFETRQGMTIMVMTKDASYHSFFSGEDESILSAYSPALAHLKGNFLVQYEPIFPAGAGTGFQCAAVAAREGVAMKDIVPLVSTVMFSVSAEYDIVHRRTLKRMPS
jgi:hypothetical protein